MSDEHATVLGEGIAEKLLAAIEALTLAVTEALPARKVWMTIDESAEYCGCSSNFIRTMISKGMLTLCGTSRAYRIYRPHLDEQIARNWPRLNIETTEEAVERILKAAPPANYMAQPRRPRKPCKPLVFK